MTARVTTCERAGMYDQPERGTAIASALSLRSLPFRLLFPLRLAFPRLAFLLHFISLLLVSALKRCDSIGK